MTYLRYALLAILLVLAVTVALANNAPVTLALWPDTVSAFTGVAYAVTLPLFVVVGAAVGLGLVLGLVWEWLRERGYRAEAARLRRELAQLRAGQAGNQAGKAETRGRKPARDDVLVIIDEAPARQ